MNETSGMFDRVMAWLEADASVSDQGFSSDTVRLAIASLFYHMIAADGVVRNSEKDRMRHLLKERFELSDERLDRLEGEAQKMDQDTAGLFPFTVVLNRELTEAERRKVLDQLDILALVDGELHPYEDVVLGHVKKLLQL